METSEAHDASREAASSAMSDPDDGESAAKMAPAQQHVQPNKPESPVETPFVEESCEDDPNFSSICSFFFKFGSSLGLSYGIEELKLWLEDSEEIAEELIELHVKLLRKRRKWINKDKWEKALVKYVAEYSNVEAWELERYGYKNVKLSIRIDVLKRLLEAQFDFNTKFKTEVNALDAASLRILPIGRDIKGNQYWYHLDPDANVRVYKEVLDDDNSWSLVCKDKEELSELIKKLETENTIEVVKEESSANASESDSESENECKNMLLDEKDSTVSENLLNNLADSLCNVKTETEASEIDREASVSSSELLNRVCSVKTEPPSHQQNVQPHRVKIEPDYEGNVVKEVIDHLVNIISPEPTDISSHASISPDVKCGVSDPDSAIVLEICNFLIETVCATVSEPAIQAPCENHFDNTDITPSITQETTARGRGRPKRGARGGARGGRGRGRPPVLSRELRELNGVNSDDEIPDFVPVKRQSRRIQVLQEKRSVELAEKMKKEQERLEELARRRAESVKQRELQRQKFAEEEEQIKKKPRYKSESESEESSEVEEEVSNSKKKKKRRKHKGRRGKRGAAFPWDSSDSDEASQKSESEEIEEEEDEVLKFDDNEDEFACEELEPDSEPIVLKRARTAKKAKSERDSSDDQDSEPEAEQIDDTMCKRCTKGDHPEWILLCDKCDAGFHTACLIPPLMIIPDGDWFCPPCENAMLVEKLQEEFSCLEKLLEQRVLEDMRKERLKFVSVSMENIIKPTKERTPKKDHGAGDEVLSKPSVENNEEEDNSESSGSDEMDESDDEFLKLRSTRNKKINYQFTEYDDLINSAIRADDYEEEEEVVEGDGYGRGKDMSTIENAAKEEEEETKQQVTESNTEDPIAPKEASAEDEVNAAKDTEGSDEDEVSGKRSARKGKKKGQKKVSKKRKLNDLDSPEEEDDSDESFKGSSATEVEEASEEEFAGSDSDATEEESEDSDFADYRRRASRSRSGGRNSRGKKSSKKGGKTKKGGRRGYRQDDFVVDSDEDYTASGSRVRTRKAATKRTSYKEVSSETEEDDEWGYTSTKKKKKRTADDSSESSDGEWGAKGRSKGKKVKKSWGAFDDDDETEEENDNKSEENSEEENSEESDNEKKAAPPPPPESKQKKRKTRGLEMRGKPRLSKARLMNLREKETDGEETDDDSNSRTRKSKAKALDSDTEPENEEGENNSEQEIDQEAGKESKLLEQVPPVSASQTVNNFSTGKAVSESPLISAALLGPSPSRPPHEVISASSHQPLPQLAAGPPELSALSQLTAFASRGPITSASSPSSQPGPPAYSNYSPSHPPIPPLVHAPSDAQPMDHEPYSLTPLDSFNSARQSGSKSLKTVENFPPRPTSPSRLNLEGHGHQHPPGYHMPSGPPRLMTPYEHYPPFDPKRGPAPGFPPGHPSAHQGARGPLPHGYPNAPGPEHYAVRGGPLAYPPGPHGYPPHHRAGYYPPSPFPPGRGPPSDMRRPMGPEMYNRHPVRHSVYQGSPSHPPAHPGAPGPTPPGNPPPPGNYYRGVPHEPLPGYYGHAHPGHGDPRSGAPVHPSSHHFPGYPHAHPQYAAFYGAPNGGFMIQNLLQHPTNSSSNANGGASGNGPSVPVSGAQAASDIPPGPPPPSVSRADYAPYGAAAQE